MHRHHPHHIAAAFGLALQLAVAGIEPVKEADQARRVAHRIGMRRVEQFLDGIVCLQPQPRDQFAPSVPRADQQPVQGRLRRIVVGFSKQFEQARNRRDGHRLTRPAQMLPQRGPLAAIAVFEQLLLAPAEQRRNQQRGEIEVIKRLHGKAQRRDQILHRERCAQPQPIYPGHRNPVRIEPRNDQPGKLSAFAHQDHHIARAGAPVVVLDQRQAGAVRIEPFGNLPGDAIRQRAVLPGKPGLLALVLWFAATGFGAIVVIVIGKASVFVWLEAGDRLPQRDDAFALLADMAPLLLGHPHRFAADMVNHLIDKFEDRSGCAERIAEIEVKQFAQRASVTQLVGIGGRIAHG